MERSIRPVTFPSTLSFSPISQPSLFLSSFLLRLHFSFPSLIVLSAPNWLYLLSYFGKSNNGLKCLTVVASPNQAALLNVHEPVLIQPEESFHLPAYTPELSILAMEINNHLSAILKWDFFNSAPKDAENHTLIRIRITESGCSDLRKAFPQS